MIQFKNNAFHLRTNQSSYLIGIREGKYLENLYFGRKIMEPVTFAPLEEKFSSGYGNAVLLPENPSVTLDNLCMEYSCAGMGDFRHSPMELIMPDGSYSTRFYFKNYQIYEGIYKESEETKMPHGRTGVNRTCDTLEMHLSDEAFGVELILIYTVFEESNVISRRTVLKNKGEQPVKIQKLMSLSIDLPEDAYDLYTFDGHWTRERHMNKHRLTPGICINDSTTGISSNRHNPLILLGRENTTEKTGDCYGVNLIYSGNHYEAIEVSPYQKTRIMTGINPHRFLWKLQPGESFYSPEAILTYSSEGRNGISQNMASFVEEHLVSPKWAKRERPILINNWEATYFNFNESKLLKLAREAKELGIELFVLDDGWFGERKDDTSSLGDWYTNEKKMGGSLSKFADKIHSYGMQFGLWIEPEMISEKSHLFEEHPDWAVRIPNRTHYTGRNQMVLDYTNPKVRKYIIERIDAILGSAAIDYVKWDMNRPLSDAYSPCLEEQGEFYHRYILGLYEVLEKLTQKYSDVLFEGCAAGGARFDLGILYYMPQIWTSDDTDAHERIAIQEGTSYGYPLSSMGAHVSAVPNHQTLRMIDLETRFAVACFGVLGYELDLTHLTSLEKKVIRSQITFYKEHRNLFIHGTFTRSRMANGNVIWQVTSSDKKEAVAMVYREHSKPNQSSDLLKLQGLDEQAIYKVEARRQHISIKQFGSLVNQVSPINITEGGLLQSAVDKFYGMESEEESYVALGDLLMYAGIKLKQRFVGTGYDENTRVMGDFSSRMYYIKQVDSGKLSVGEKREGEVENER